MNEILNFASSHPKVPLNSKEIEEKELNKRKRIDPRALDLIGSGEASLGPQSCSVSPFCWV